MRVRGCAGFRAGSSWTLWGWGSGGRGELVRCSGWFRGVEVCVADVAAGAERPEGSGWVAWLAHRELWFLAAICAGLTVQLVLRLAGFVSAASVVNLVSMWSWVLLHRPIRKHFSRICVECVSMMPADGGEVVKRRMRWLRMHHFQVPRRLLWVILLAILLVALAVGALAVLVFSPTVNAVLVWAVLVSMFVAFDMSAVVHRPLVPWCPFCRWGRGDDEDAPVEPSPVPAPSADPVMAR